MAVITRCEAGAEEVAPRGVSGVRRLRGSTIRHSARHVPPNAARYSSSCAWGSPATGCAGRVRCRPAAGRGAPARLRRALRRARTTRQSGRLARPLGPRRADRRRIGRPLQDLQRLPRVGPALARAIVADRDGQGRSGHCRRCDRVPGIGPEAPAAWRRILPSRRGLAPGGAPSAQPASGGRRRRVAGTGAIRSVINRGSTADLSGIGHRPAAGRADRRLSRQRRPLPSRLPTWPACSASDCACSGSSGRQPGSNDTGNAPLPHAAIPHISIT